jgi:ferric-dicitrate binding protein FerR (iron transport regulator)
MEDKETDLIEQLLPEYFSGEINEEDRKKVDSWRNTSVKNNDFFKEMSAVWESGAILEQMEQFNAKEALLKINKRLVFYKKPYAVWQNIQRIAALLLLPVLIYSGYLTFYQIKGPTLISNERTWQKVKTATGMVSELVLPDGTHVWLNSETKLEYPLDFEKNREVNLSGEAYFEVKKDQQHPFIVNTGTINIEVLGTSFNVTNYPGENQTEVVLKSGKVQLFTGTCQEKEEISFLLPNQKATFNSRTKELFVNNIKVDKYTAWKDGVLMFVDDPMNEVTKKLSRWFNIDFILESNELENYIYKATFKNESLIQVLDLLKLSAPIEYTIRPRELLPNGDYSKEIIIIRKREI